MTELFYIPEWTPITPMATHLVTNMVSSVYLLKIQIRILLDYCARVRPDFSVSGTVGLGVIPHRYLGSMVDNVSGI